MTQIDEALVRIRAAFARQATDRALRLVKALGEDDTVTVIEIAHKIAGIAGMVGFADLGDQAARVENLVDGRAAPAELAAATSRLVDDLMQLGTVHPPETK